MIKILQYPKALWILALGMMINITGSSFLWPLNSIYMTQHLGQALSTAGTVLMFHAGAGIIGNLLGGWLYDRLGGKWTILLGVLSGMLCAFSLAFFQEWWIYIVLMILLGFSNGIVFPAIYAMAGGVWPEGGRKSFNVIYVAQNLGVAVGTAIGGLVAQVSFTLVFMVNGLSFLIFLSIVWFGIDEKTAVQPRGDMNRQDMALTSNLLRKKEAFKSILSLMILSCGFMVCWVSYVQWQTSISVYMQDLGYSLSSYSLLWTINGLLIILAQPFSAFITARVIPSVKLQLVVGVLIFIVSLSVLSQTSFYTGFVIAMIIMTIGEIFIWPAVPTAAQELAPEGKKGLYQGVVGSSATGGRMLGPFIGGLLFEAFNMQILFYLLVVICSFALLCFVFYDVLLSRSAIRKKTTQKLEY